MDRAWVADHVLNDCMKEGEGLYLKHKDETMTVPSHMVDPKKWEKGQKEHRDKFGRNPYYLYGIVFVPDEKQQSLF
jgi:hypothetical protein